MYVTVEIPDDRIARFQRQAQARGLTVDRWLLELAEQNAPLEPSPRVSLADVCAKIRGLAEDLDLTRNQSPGRDIDLMSGFLVDTNVPSELIRARTDPRVNDW